MSVTSNNLYSTTGIQLPTDACVVIVYTEWNQVTIDKLKEGACKILDEYKVSYRFVEVPGAIEIPFAIKCFWENESVKPHAFIALGCVIRGGTPHFEYVSKSVTNGILQLNLSLPVPTVFGVLTLDNQTQADERTGGIHGHKGEEAALAAIKMISLVNSIKNK
jgi:6,7-dimethyl-8-ribityllumazine synthase